MKFPRVLFILHTPPPVHGSSMVGQYINESEIINNSFNCRYINLSTSRSVDEMGKNPLQKIVRYLSLLWKVLVQLIRFKPQLCYIAITSKGLAFYKDTVVVFLVKLFGVKLVYHFHNKGVSTREHKPFDNFIYKKVFKNAEVILLSKYLYPDIHKYVPENRVHYCPNGIPDKIITNNQKKDSRNSIVEILFLSNLIKSKGIFILLEALRELQKKELRFHCTIVGGESDITSEILQRKLDEMELNDLVCFVGKKTGYDKQLIFYNADIFAFPTFYHYECFPLVLLEAMQFSLPVVSTFEGGIPDVVEDGVTGFLVPQRKADALAEKLELLIKDPGLRTQMGSAGRLKYEREFTLQIFEERLKQSLKKIISN